MVRSWPSVETGHFGYCLGNRLLDSGPMATKLAAQPPIESKTVRPSLAEVLPTIRQQYLAPLVLVVLFCWLAFSIFGTVEQILKYYNPLPYWDYWRVAQNLSDYQHFHLRILWKQHNDHRIIFPEVIFALDMLALHGRMILPLAVSLLCYIGTWLVISSTLFADLQVGRQTATAASLLAGGIVFWHGSAVLLAAPFQLQWTIMQFAAGCSLVSLIALKESSKTIYLASLICCAAIANYSSGNGLLLWPVLLGFGAAVRLKRRHLFTIGIAAIVFASLYFVDYKFSNDLNLRNLFSHPIYLVEYVASYVSMPFGGMKTPIFGIYIGLANLVLTIAFFAITLRRGLLATRPGIVLLGSFVFTILTILLTAAGRMDPNDPTFSGAKPPRYITVPLLNWAVFILLCFWTFSRLRVRSWLRPVLCVAIGSLLMVYLPKLRDWMALITEDYSEQQLSALSMENDIFDANLLRKIFISPEFIMQYVPELRAQHLSIYYKGHDRWLGKPLSRFSRVLDITIAGQITNTYPVRGGIETTGWADATGLRRSYTWIVLTNENGRIIGFGRRLAAGFPAILASDNTPSSLAWAGFTNLSIPTQSISAYAVDSRRGGLYQISGSVPIPVLRQGSLEETAGNIPEITWQKSKIWTRALPGRVEFGQVPPGEVNASWSGNDANEGDLISSSFVSPPNGCLTLPVLHGPKTGGLSVTVMDADTAQPVAKAPMQDGDTRWEYWRVPVPATVRHLRVVASDKGKAWGEWVATANPLTCR